VPVLATVRSGDRLHAVRPSPTGLHREAGRGGAAHAHNVHAPVHEPCGASFEAV
jgi:hypothetical protein